MTQLSPQDRGPSRKRSQCNTPVPSPAPGKIATVSSLLGFVLESPFRRAWFSTITPHSRPTALLTGLCNLALPEHVFFSFLSLRHQEKKTRDFLLGFFFFCVCVCGGVPCDLLKSHSSFLGRTFQVGKFWGPWVSGQSARLT